MKVSFNGVTKIIQVIEAPDGDGNVNIDVKIDLYSDWKEWQLMSDNSKFLEAMRTVGGDPLPGSKSLGATFFLINDWKIRPYEGDHTLNINGNLYCEDGSVPYVSTIGSYNVMVINSVSSLVDSIVQQLKEIEYASFGGGITIDIINGTAGTAFPIGTIESPVDNVIDGALIADERGFHTFFIKGDIILSNTVNLENYTIEGESITKTNIIIEPSALVFGTEFINATITGTLDGDNVVHHCAIQTLDYVNGHIHNCLLEEYTMTLGGTAGAVFLGCWSFGASQDTIPVIDMGGSGRNLIMRGHSGGIKLINKTGPEDVVLDFESGRVIIDSTVTAGNIIIRGIGQVTDNSTGTAMVNTDGVVSQTTIADAVWDETLSDHSGVSGSTGEALNQAATASGLPAEITEQDKLDIADRVWDEYTSGHTVSGTFGQKIVDIYGRVDIAQAEVNDPTPTTTKFVSTLTETAMGFWARGAMMFTSGNNSGVIRGIKNYNGDTKEVQLQTPLSYLPVTGDGFSIIPARKFLTPDVEDIVGGVWDEPFDIHTVSGTYGKLMPDIKVEVDAITIKLPTGDIAEFGEYTTLLNNIETYILRSLGLVQENFYLDQTSYTTYQGAKLMTDGRIRIYSDDSSVGTDNNVTATYQIVSTWSGDELTSYKVMKT